MRLLGQQRDAERYQRYRAKIAFDASLAQSRSATNVKVAKNEIKSNVDITGKNKVRIFVLQPRRHRKYTAIARRIGSDVATRNFE